MDPNDVIFVKHDLFEDNLADFINYCNRMRPQQQAKGGVPTFVRVVMFEPADITINYLRTSHKIHWLGTVEAPSETEKAVILSVANAKRLERCKTIDKFFQYHVKCLFALDPWESVDLSKEVEKLKRELQEIKDAILYAPGGPIFQQSKASYDSIVLSQQDPAASYPLPKKHKQQQ